MKKIAALAFLLCALMITAPVHALPLSVQVDMLETKLVEQLKDKQYADALETIRDLKATGIKLPPSLDYFEGKALFESGQQAASYDRFAHYVETRGKEGKYYREAIAYLIKAEASRKAALPWKHVFGGSKDDEAYAIVQTADGGFALAGKTESKGAGKSDAWVIRLNPQGEVLWDRTFGGGRIDEANAIVQTADGGFAVAGTTMSKGAGEEDAWVIRLDAQGKLLWDRTFGGDGNDEADAIVQTADGGFAMAASSFSYGTGHWDARVVRLDAQGKRLWDRTYGGSVSVTADAMVQTADGGFALAGDIVEEREEGGRIWHIWHAKVMRLDAQGEVLWDRTFTEDGIANALVQTADGGVALAGYNQGAEHWDAWVIRLDAKGERLWDRTFGGSKSDDASAIVQTADGGFAVACTTESKGAGKRDAWVLRLDAQGKILWDQTFGGGKGDGANAMVQTADGGFALAGYTYSKGAGLSDAWLLLLDGDGELE